MAAKSIKLVLQLVLKQDWQEAKNRKADKETNAEKKNKFRDSARKARTVPGGSDRVHRAAHLLESGARLND